MTLSVNGQEKKFSFSSIYWTLSSTEFIFYVDSNEDYSVTVTTSGMSDYVINFSSAYKDVQWVYPTQGRTPQIENLKILLEGIPVR